jgi:uncharacterized damage-inducible protein DinB
MTEDLRYPVGKPVMESNLTPERRAAMISEIANLPSHLRDAIAGLTEAQLDTPYRPGGWTVRQVVHHLADSHLNSFTRFKLALTEDNPTIKPYDEKRWAEMDDARTAPVETSLAVLAGLHYRWEILLQSATDADFARTFNHPERGKMSLETTLCLYAWHCRHHVAHITSLRSRMGW